MSVSGLKLLIVKDNNRSMSVSNKMSDLDFSKKMSVA